MIRLFLIFAVPCAILLYAPALQAPLYLDDSLVLQSAHLSLGSRAVGYASFWVSDQLAPLFAPALPFRAPFYYRFGNVLIHALAAAALFWLARELTGRSSMGWAAGTLFLVHPIQTQAVTYISQRFESQATWFMLLSAAAYVKFRQSKGRKWALASIIFGAGALLSKESAAALPLWILFIEIVFFGWQEIRKRLHYLAILGVVFAIPTLRAIWNAGPTLSSIPWHHYLLSQGPVLSKYLSLVVWPRELFLYYDFPVIETLSAGVILNWILVLAIAASGLALLRWDRLIGFGLISFFILLSVVTVLPLPDLIFEHRVYPAMAGLSLALAGALHRMKTSMALTVMGCLVLPLAYRTFTRNVEWQDPIPFMESHRARFPNEPIILTNLGSQYAKRGAVAKALSISKEAKENMGRTNPYYRKHVGFVNAVNLGFQSLDMHDVEAARREAEIAIRLNPADPEGWRLKAAVEVSERDFLSAASTYKTALTYAPLDLRIWGALYQTFKDLNDPESAALVVRRIQAIETAAAARPSTRLVLPVKYKAPMIYGLTLSMLALIVWAARTVWMYLPRSTSFVAEGREGPRSS